MSDEYNGWTNWDTWNCNLWLNNDEDYYKEARRICGRNNLNHAEVLLEKLAKGIIPANEGIDYSEVNWEEIYKAFEEEE